MRRGDQRVRFFRDFVELDLDDGRFLAGRKNKYYYFLREVSWQNLHVLIRMYVPIPQIPSDLRT
jgi:hypothetical protein